MVLIISKVLGLIPTTTTKKRKEKYSFLGVWGTLGFEFRVFHL
jgi:hypothetical protein